MKSDVVSAILEAKRAKVPVALLTWLRTGEQIIVGPASVSHDTELDSGARELLAEDRSERVVNPFTNLSRSWVQKYTDLLTVPSLEGLHGDALGHPCDLIP